AYGQGPAQLEESRGRLHIDLRTPVVIVEDRYVGTPVTVQVGHRDREHGRIGELRRQSGDGLAVREGSIPSAEKQRKIPEERSRGYDNVLDPVSIDVGDCESGGLIVGLEVRRAADRPVLPTKIDRN